MLKKQLLWIKQLSDKDRFGLVFFSFIVLTFSIFWTIEIIHRFRLANNHAYIIGNIQQVKRGHKSLIVKVNYRYMGKRYVSDFTPMDFKQPSSRYVFLAVLKSKPTYCVFLEDERVARCYWHPAFMDSAWDKLPECPLDSALLGWPTR
jgi:hypothetical protein